MKLFETMKLFTPMTLQKFPPGKIVILLKLNFKLNYKLFLFPNHCEEYAEMRAFSDPYFPVYGQNSIRISLYKDRIVDRKKQTRESPYFGVFYTLNI